MENVSNIADTDVLSFWKKHVSHIVVFCFPKSQLLCISFDKIQLGNVPHRAHFDVLSFRKGYFSHMDVFSFWNEHLLYVSLDKICLENASHRAHADVVSGVFSGCCESACIFAINSDLHNTCDSEHT